MGAVVLAWGDNVIGQIRLLLIIGALGVLSACGGGGSGGLTDPGTPPATGSVSGTVTFKGSPMSGVTVTAWECNTNTIVQTTTTNASGNYSFSGLSAAGDVAEEYQFWALKTGYGFYPSVGSGAKVIRAGQNSQFQGLNTNNIGVDFTVIDWVAVAGGSLPGANFAAYNGSNPLVSLAGTGQAASYVSGDDGSLRKGVVWPGTRFTNNQNGTVTDNLTGLIWLRNAGCFSPTLWSNALTDVNQLSSGVCGLIDGSSAGQWRLPNLNELESLVDVSTSNPALTAGNPFASVSTGIYWTSTSYYGGEAGSPYAWAIRFSDGRYINDMVSNVKATSNNAVWAVRGSGGGAVNLQATGLYVAYESGDDGTLQTGVRLTYPRWIDNGNGTVTDTMTGLIWLKQANCINQPWAAAVAAVNQLASGQCGLTDNSTAGSWRMPNRNEVQSMADRMQATESDYFNNTIVNLDGTIYQPPIFTNFVTGAYYWTSTTDAANTSEAWTVFSCDFGVYDISKADTGYTLAVR